MGKKDLFNKVRKKLNSHQLYTVSSGAICDVGNRRSNNEDNFLLVGQINDKMENHREAASIIQLKEKDWVAYGVFDGMGGCEAGEIAAILAAGKFEENTRKSRLRSKEDVDSVARYCYQESNQAIIKKQREINSLLGTTGTAVFTNGREFKVFHLGDSRAYLFRNGILGQITRDQTLAEMKIQTGAYHRGDLEELKDRHKLVCYIGCDEESQAVMPEESIWIEVKPGDRILLCSDGLYDMCSDEEILSVFHELDATSDILNKLQSLAKGHGGKDNVTCLLITFHMVRDEKRV